MKEDTITQKIANELKAWKGSQKVKLIFMDFQEKVGQFF